MHLSDLIQINQHSGDAAVNVARSLNNHNLVESFSPTKAAVTVLKHLREAVLPNASQQDRALNVYGSYGSGKSHLSVVIAQLLRDGCGDVSFIHFFERLNHFGETQLAENLKNTFLAQGDKDAKPYLLVSLEGQGLPSIGSVLMKELYDAVKRRGLNPAEILPATEYDVCIKRFEEICRNSPELANVDLSQWNLHQYLTTAYLLDALKSHDPDALETFKHWHKAVCLGSEFSPVNEGGSNFISAYVEAGKNLAEKHSFAGILIVWDEFGGALEDLLRNPNRNASGEILDLQRFVETVCSPAQGHTIFIGLTHVSFEQYGVRMNCDEVLKNRLETIFGRFRDFEIELSAAESEGYHLLGMQKSWNDYGKARLKQFRANQENVVGVCSALPLFKNLGQQLTQVSDEIYPLHPIMAAGLFGLSALAQATRTALTFFRDNQEMINSRSISERGIFTDELIRLPELVDYYGDAIKKNKAHEFERYQRAVNKIPVTESRGKSDILKLLLLAEFLGENFQTNETFLACALYDTSHVSALDLQADLNYLKQAQLIWKNDATQQWTLLGDSGVNVEGSDKKTIDAYNDEAEKIAKLHASLTPHRIYELIEQYFIKGKSTADIGCGIGRDTNFLNSQGFSVVGVDASQGMLKQARQLYPDLDFQLDYLPTLARLENSTFQNILCSAVLMHLDEIAIEAACLRLVELLKKDGRLIISIRGTNEKDKRENGKLYEAISVESFKELFEKNGCEILLYESEIEQKRGLTWNNFVIKK